MKKQARKSRPVRKSQRSSSQPIAAAAPMGIPNAAEIMRLKARGRTEADMIATALQDAPPLDREGMGAELFPFNDIASSDAVQAVVGKIVRKRLAGSAWPDASAALMKTDDNGKGYSEFMDTYRDVSFAVGVDFALRSMPSWWPLYNELPIARREGLGRIIAMTAKAELDDAKGGRR